MSTGLTLFGGLVAVVVLFLLARARRLPVDLSTLLAAGIPLLGYFVYLFNRWPGLDVVAMHIALFISAAMVLGVYEKYRARQARMHWVPKAFILFFVMLALMNAGFLYLATKGLPSELAALILPTREGETVHTGFSGATRHGQDAAKAVSAELSRAHQNHSLGWSVQIQGLKNPEMGENRITLQVQDAKGRPLSGLDGEFRLSRPGSQSKRIPLKQLADGEYEAALLLNGGGIWLVELSLTQEESAYRQTWELKLP